MTTNCEFCTELRTPQKSRFATIYRDTVTTRVIAEHGGIVAMPTIGQLFPSSILVLPKRHCETIADLRPDELDELFVIVDLVQRRIRDFGQPIIWEHGARSCTNRSCGIYHAHAHIVPLPGMVALSDFLPDDSARANNLKEAFISLKGSDTYLLMVDSSGRIGFVAGRSANSPEYSSQYFRRKLAHHFKLNQPWNWRDYNYQETMLLNTLNRFA